MTELRRLVDASGNPELRELLEAGLSDAPPRNLAASVQAAIAAGAVVPISAVLAGSAGAAAVKGSSAALPMPHFVALVAKPLLVGVLGGSVVCGAAAAVNGGVRLHSESVAVAPSLPGHIQAAPRRTVHPSEPQRANPSEPLSDLPSVTGFPDLESEPVAAKDAPLANAELAIAQDSPLANELANPRTSSSPSLQTSSRRAATAARAPLVGAPKRGGHRTVVAPTALASAAASSPSAPPSSTVSQSALRAEIERLDLARSALSAGDPERARAALDAYDAQPKLGVLEREALLLRIDVANRRGEIKLVRALAQRYLERFAGDPHAAHMRELLRSASEP